MDSRYDLLKAARARTSRSTMKSLLPEGSTRSKATNSFLTLYLVIDEFADLIMTAGKEIGNAHRTFGTVGQGHWHSPHHRYQRPSVNIITGIIKANFPARLAFKVTSKVDSRTILDAGGAEQLIGRGDMLLSIGSSVVRLQCAFVDTPEVEDVIKFISDQPGFEPFFLPEVKTDDDAGSGMISMDELDDMFEEAARVIIGNQHGSTSMIQRKLQLGYNRAGRIMDQMEKVGLVGPAQGSKPREVLVYGLEELDNIMRNLKNRFNTPLTNNWGPVRRPTCE